MNLGKLYEQPGAYLVDHPHGRRQIAAIIAALTFIPAVQAVAATHVKPEKVKPTPGHIRNYSAPVERTFTAA